MTVDRYTKLILTVIALELGWIAINGTGVPVLAQRSEATPVIIRFAVSNCSNFENGTPSTTSPYI